MRTDRTSFMQHATGQTPNVFGPLSMWVADRRGIYRTWQKTCHKSSFEDMRFMTLLFLPRLVRSFSYLIFVLTIPESRFRTNKSQNRI